MKAFVNAHKMVFVNAHKMPYANASLHRPAARKSIVESGAKWVQKEYEKGTKRYKKSTKRYKKSTKRVPSIKVYHPFILFQAQQSYSKEKFIFFIYSICK